MIENTYRCWEIFLLVVQCILLASNAILLWRYVISTRGIEEASTQQAKISADQLESSSRPVLALSGDALKLALEILVMGRLLTLNGGSGLKDRIGQGPSKLHRAAWGSSM
jgi:hypothetical protein